MQIKLIKHKIRAFTLSEVLITLGVIGTIAALTLPSLIQTKRNKILETAFKKNYSILLQAFEMYQAEQGQRLKPEIIGSRDSGMGLQTQIMPYFKVRKDCQIQTFGESTCIYRAKIMSTYKTFTGNQYLPDWWLFDDGHFVLADDTLIMIENGNDRTYAAISFDVNGVTQGPNKWGHDLFTFQIMKDGKILPTGAPDTKYNDKSQYCSKDSTQGYNGVGCAYYALNDKNYFKNLPK